MTDPMNPGQLPQGTHSLFVAYGPAVRIADPQGGEDPITVRPQTFVTYYRGITMKAITEGGRSGDADVATVEFEPESVNLREPISAKIDPDDPLLSYLREQYDAGNTVDVAIEVIRKVKNRSTKQPINVLVPIHALRGGSDPSGTGAQTGPSFDNTRKMLVMANGRPGRALTSNPHEWASLVTNKAGNLPPEGWRFYAPGDSWDECGAIVPVTTTTAPTSGQGTQSTAPPDLSAFLAEMETLVHKVLDYREANPNVEVMTGRPTRRRFDEGKQWDLRTNDGRINLGGYGVQSQGWTYRWAHELLTTDSSTPSTTDAWALADTVMTLADQVQADAYGHGVTPDRTSASHKEAVRWVEWIITRHHPYPGTDGDIATWAGEVTKTAIEHLVESGKRLGDWVQENKTPKPAQRDAETDEPSGPSPAVVKALLGSIQRTWNNQDALGNFAQEALDRGLAETEVGISLDNAGTPTLSHPIDPQSTGSATLGQLITQRIAELDDQPDPTPTPASNAAPEPSPAPQAATTHDGDDAAFESAAQEPLEPQQPTAAQDPNRGYTPQVVEVLRAIHNATDLATLRDAYDLAERRTLLQSTVSSRRTQAGTFEFGYKGQEGYASTTLAQVIDALRERLTATPDPSAEQGTEPTPDATPEPEPLPVADERPTADTPATEKADPTPDPTPDSVAQQIAASINAQTSTSEEVGAAIERAQQEGVFETSVTVDGRTGLLRAYLHSVRKRVEKAGR